MGSISHFLRQLACLSILFYQRLIRPIMRPCCRYYPSCSDYALDALKSCGLIKGMQLMIWRLLRCHPWSKGGYDPVPNKEKT